MIAKKLEVNGIAIRSGISRNGIMYTKEELNSFSATLEGRPILKDHRSETDNTIGLVTETTNNDNSGVVGWNGWVKEDGSGIIEKINDKRVKEVSIGATVKRLVKENKDDEHMIAVGIEALELSTTPTPGVRGTSIQQCISSLNEKVNDKSVKVKPICENSKDFKEIKEDTHLEKIKQVEEINMSNEDETSVSKEALELAHEQIKEEKAQKAKLSEEIKEEIQQVAEKIENNIKEELKKMKEDNEGDAPVEAPAEEPVEAPVEEPKVETPVEEPAEDKKEPEFKSEVKKDDNDGDAQESVLKDYTVESCSYGPGFSLSKEPKADGSY